MTTTTQETYGNFGNNAEMYHRHRDTIPDQLYDFVLNRCISLNAVPSRIRVLDVACGTGLSTRGICSALERHNVAIDTILGIDCDKKMIKEARKDPYFTVPGSFPKATFAHAMAHEVPNDWDFHLILCISAFHWFCNDSKAVKAIYESLGHSSDKNKWPFVVINREFAVPDLRSKIRGIISEMSGNQELPDSKKKYYPEQIMEIHGFEKIEVHYMQYKEPISLSNAMSRIKTMSLWQSIPNNKLSKADEALAQLIIDTCGIQENMTELSYEVKIVSGRKLPWKDPMPGCI